MPTGLQKNPQIKILPASGANEMLRLHETDIEDVVKTVQDVLPPHVDGDTDVTITLLEENLKLMADMTIMKEALAHLVRNAIPDCRKFSLTINQVNFEIESLLNGNDSIIGACAFISLAGLGTYICVDEKIKKKIFEPFFITKTDVYGLTLAIAYRIIKQQRYGRIKVKNRVGQGAEVNMYLPLTKLEIVSMMSIPTG